MELKRTISPTEALNRLKQNTSPHVFATTENIIKSLGETIGKDWAVSPSEDNGACLQWAQYGLFCEIFDSEKHKGPCEIMINLFSTSTYNLTASLITHSEDDAAKILISHLNKK